MRPLTTYEETDQPLTRLRVNDGKKTRYEPLVLTEAQRCQLERSLLTPWVIREQVEIVKSMAEKDRSVLKAKSYGHKRVAVDAKARDKQKVVRHLSRGDM